MLAVDDLETVWERLAEAVDAAGPERDRLLLAKLVLLFAEELGDAARAGELIALAAQDLS